MVGGNFKVAVLKKPLYQLICSSTFLSKENLSNRHFGYGLCFHGIGLRLIIYWNAKNMRVKVDEFKVKTSYVG